MVIRSAASGPKPMSPIQPSTVWIGSASVPSAAPSNVVAPIVNNTSATEPDASPIHLVDAESIRRRPSVRSRTSNPDRVENMWK